MTLTDAWEQHRDVHHGPESTSGCFPARCGPDIEERLRPEATADLIRGAFEVLEAYGGHLDRCPVVDPACTCGWREEIDHLRRQRAALKEAD